MAISRLMRTTILITEYEPNISRPQKRVKPLIPTSSKLSKSMRPKAAQNSVCDVSNRLCDSNNSIVSYHKEKWTSVLLGKSSPNDAGIHIVTTWRG